MFNIGKVIKAFSIIISFLLFIGILISTAYLWNNTHIYYNVNLYIIVGIMGLLTSFTIFLLLYGFGALIDTNYQILKQLEKEKK